MSLRLALGRACGLGRRLLLVGCRGGQRLHVAFLRLLLVLVRRLGLLLRALAPPAPARATGVRLRRGQVVGERVGDLVDRRDPLAGGLDQLVGARRVALGRREQRDTDLQRLLEGGVDQPGGVLLVTVPARVRKRTQQALRLRELRASPPILRLARGAGELPGPAAEDLLGRVCLALSERPQERPDALDAVLFPRRRLGDERDEVIEVRALDLHRDAVGERDQPEPPVRVLRRAGEQELLEATTARAPVGQLLDELGPLVEPHLAAGDRRPEALFVLVEVAGVDSLPLACDHVEAALDVRRHRDEPRRRRELAAGSAVRPPPGGRRDTRALAVEVGVEQAVERDDALG